MVARRVLVALLGLAACRIGFEDVGPGRTDSALAGDSLQPDSDGLAGPDDAGLDATRSVPPGDAGACLDVACAAAGGACVAGACELVATDELPRACPPGMPCRVLCSGFRFCRDGVTCAGASWCEVRCIGFRACQAGVTCGTAQCDVTCDGEEACADGITVAPGGSCVASCCGLDACLLGTSTCTTDATCT